MKIALNLGKKHFKMSTYLLILLAFHRELTSEQRICMYFKLAKSPSNTKIFSPNNFYQLGKGWNLSIQKKNDENRI